MGTGERLTASERVQRLQTALHAKAKEAPGFRFYSLSDKVWRDDVLAVAWQAVRRNGGAAGVDGETVADIESFGSACAVRVPSSGADAEGSSGQPLAEDAAQTWMASGGEGAYSSAVGAQEHGGGGSVGTPHIHGYSDTRSSRGTFRSRWAFRVS